MLLKLFLLNSCENEEQKKENNGDDINLGMEKDTKSNLKGLTAILINDKMVFSE